jgi:hypothetical protein
MRAPAIERMIVPGPTRRRVDLEADLTAQALTGGGFAEAFWSFSLRRHSGAMRSIEPGISRFPDVRLHI